MNVAAKLEGVAAAAADVGRTREALALCLHAHTLQVRGNIRGGLGGAMGYSREGAVEAQRYVFGALGDA